MADLKITANGIRPGEVIVSLPDGSEYVTMRMLFEGGGLCAVATAAGRDYAQSTRALLERLGHTVTLEVCEGPKIVP